MQEITLYHAMVQTTRALWHRVLVADAGQTLRLKWYVWDNDKRRMVEKRSTIQRRWVTKLRRFQN